MLEKPQRDPLQRGGRRQMGVQRHAFWEKADGAQRERLSAKKGGREAPDGHFQFPQQRTRTFLGNDSRKGMVWRERKGSRVPL